MYLASVAWHFLAMLPASVRLLTKDVKDRAFKWLSFMHHEFTQIITTLLSEMEMMRNKQNLKLPSQPSSNLLSRVSSSPFSYILGRSHKFWLTFGHYRSLHEPKKSNPIKWQNFNLSFISQFLSSPTQVFLQTFLCHQMALFKISGTHTAFPDACKTFFSFSFARSLIPTPGNSLGSAFTLSEHPSHARSAETTCAILHSIRLSTRKQTHPSPPHSQTVGAIALLASVCHFAHLQPSSCLLISPEKNQALVPMLPKL